MAFLPSSLALRVDVGMSESWGYVLGAFWRLQAIGLDEKEPIEEPGGWFLDGLFSVRAILGRGLVGYLWSGVGSQGGRNQGLGVRYWGSQTARKCT